MPKYKRTFIEDDEDNEDLTNTPPTNGEVTWEKRYADLRSHSQKQLNDMKRQLDDLNNKLVAAEKSKTNLPKTREEVEAWATKFPDAYAFVKSVIGIDLQEATSSIEQRFAELQERETETAKERAEAKLLSIHPDFSELKSDEAFIAWLESKSQRTQDALYEGDDPIAAAEVVSLYKLETGVKRKTPANNRDAAREVATRRTPVVPGTRGEAEFSESQIANMKPWEYEENEEAIEKARREGRIVMDLSGGAY